MAPSPACQQCSSLTFTQGFIVGQTLMIVLALLFVKYVVFEDKEPRAEIKARKKPAQKLSNLRHHRRGSSVEVPQDLAILDKLQYNLDRQPVETSAWLNVLIAQVIARYRNVILSGDESESGGAKGFVEKLLNSHRPSEENAGFVGLDHIEVDELHLGDSYPTLSNARVSSTDEEGRLQIDLDIDYIDGISINIGTKVYLNFPQPKFAILPVSLGLRLVQFSATASIEILQNSLDSPPTIAVCLHPDFILEMECTSLIGSRAKLENIPKIEQLLINRIRAAVIERLVWPRQHRFNLPDLGTSVSLAGKDFIMVEHTSTTLPTSSTRPDSDTAQGADSDNSHDRRISSSTYAPTGDPLNEQAGQDSAGKRRPALVVDDSAMQDPWADYSLPGRLNTARQSYRASLGPSHLRNRTSSVQ